MYSVGADGDADLVCAMTLSLHFCQCHIIVRRVEGGGEMVDDEPWRGLKDVHWPWHDHQLWMWSAPRVSE